MNSVAKSDSTDMSVQEEAYDWHLRISEADVTADERRAFEEWRNLSAAHEVAYQRAQGFVAALNELTLSDFDDDLRQTLLSERIRSWWSGLLSRESNWQAWVVPGSALTAIAVVILFFRSDPVSYLPEAAAPIVHTYTSAVGEIRTVTLDDGSVATIGAATTLQVTFKASQRQAQLDSGNVFFDVAPDAARPFLVRSGDLTIEVLGTSFDVRNNGGMARVAVSEGTVEVRHPLVFADREIGLVKSVELVAGQQIAISNRSLGNISAIDPATVGAWRKDRLEYRRAPLSEVVSEVNRYSTTPISISSAVGQLGSLNVSGIFDAGQPDLILERLPKVLPITIDRSDPNRIVIRPHANDKPYL